MNKSHAIVLKILEHMDRFLNIFGRIRNNSEPPGKQSKWSGSWSEEDTDDRY